MKLANLLKMADSFGRENSTSILTGIGVAGTAVTAYLTGRASWQAGQIIQQIEITEGTADSAKDRFVERASEVWQLYIPPVLAGTITVSSILGAQRMNTRKTVALTAAYSLSERAFHDYREKVIETIGEGKDKKIRGEVATDKLRSNPPSPSIVVTEGEVLCCELHTGRYFKSSAAGIQKAVNTVNAMVNRHTKATLADLQYELGLDITPMAFELGWQEELIKLDISAVLTEDEQPCLAFNYDNLTTL